VTNDNPMPKLTPKAELFCISIVEGLSQSDAYRKAYRPRLSKAKTIHEESSRLMSDPKVTARIAELMKPVIVKAQMSRQEWLELVEKCCRFDPRRMFDAMGNPKEITELDEKAVGYTKKFRLIDRLRALELLGKACHWYADRQEQTGPDG
jgi:phage terminase small subunit